MTDRLIRRLVMRASRRDAEAFGKLYDAYADRVYGFVRLRVRDGRDAEELVETIFLKVWQGLPAYEHRGLPFEAWLFRIARNAVIDSHRRAGREPALAEEAEAHHLASAERPDDEVLRRLEGERVRAAMQRLTEEQASVVSMRYLLGLSLKDVAAVLETTEGAVKALQHRALRSLARVLAEDALDEGA